MKKYITGDEWRILEEGFDPERHKSSESIFSIGNGHMGQRANFEEEFSGSSLQGIYLAGIYYPDKTKVGWWKNGYPDYYAKVINAPNWIGFKIQCNNLRIDLNTMKISRFTRELNMKEGILRRHVIAGWDETKVLEIKTERFVSMIRKELGLIRYEITPLNFDCHLDASLLIDADVRNQDANYDEYFWECLEPEQKNDHLFIQSKTKKTGFEVCTGMTAYAEIKGSAKSLEIRHNLSKRKAETNFQVTLQAGDRITFYKFASVVTSRDHKSSDLLNTGESLLQKAVETGYHNLLLEQKQFWADVWKESDIQIEGDLSAQQGIRFNIFQLNQTYTGHDPRLNIGPKGFTGEKYGGGTYWDTEAFCLPFYLNSAESRYAKNLLLYRYRQLDKAIENAGKLGFSGGSALFPMVTMNGEECHNEWEITFEEIHRNGAIAYAIFNYIRHTGDKNYLISHGLEVLIAISRFWVQRISFSSNLQKYVILGVTGPNEYENNVNNNWYTNYICAWTLEYTTQAINWASDQYPDEFGQLKNRVNLNHDEETRKWQSVIDHLYLPEDVDLGIFLQQDGYLDKEQVLAGDLDPAERPINQHWSWDRILRSSLIKQADVLQGLYFFKEHFDMETIRRNFDFYEPRTVHESSLSPCIHSILAAKLGYSEKAYELYLRTSRLDLDDYNHEVEQGCHITSMAGTWLAVIEGFGGMRVSDDHLSFNPLLPKAWNSLKFQIQYRCNRISVLITSNFIEFNSKQDIAIQVYGKETFLPALETVRTQK